MVPSKVQEYVDLNTQVSALFSELKLDISRGIARVDSGGNLSLNFTYPGTWLTREEVENTFLPWLNEVYGGSS